MTAPQGSVCNPSSSSQSAPGLVETLYNHPNVKIIAFTASGRNRARSPGRAPPDEEPGSLASSSQLERTIAVGPFRIYRAPGSVAFLNCGSALQPILPKSQCWCIDEVSNKFVLQIRRPQYWRIEVPVSDPEEKELAHALRGVFDQILQFEKTACPFKRSFTIALPEKPKTPIKKRPWTPVRRSITPTAMTIVEATTTPPARTTRRKSESPAARQLKASMKATFTADEDSTTRSEVVPDNVVQRTNVQAPEAQTPEVQAPDARGVPPVSSVAEEGMSTQIEAITEAAKQPNDASGRNTADETENRDKEERPVADHISVFEQPESTNNTLEILPGTSACEPDVAVILATTNDVNDDARVRTEATEAEQNQEIPPETAIPLAPMQAHPLSEVRDISTPQSNSPPTLLPVQEAEEVCEELPPLTAIRREEPFSVPPEFSTPETAVELTPRQTSTHTRPDIHDFLRAYEQKAAAEAQTNADVEPSVIVEDVELPAAADDDTKSTASGESDPETAGTGQTSAEVLEGSGVVGARRKKLRGFRAGRSLAVPPQLTLITSPPSKSAASKQSPTRLPEDAKGQISPAGHYKFFKVTGLFVFCNLLFVAGFALRIYGAWHYDNLAPCIASICLVYASPRQSRADSHSSGSSHERGTSAPPPWNQSPWDAEPEPMGASALPRREATQHERPSHGRRITSADVWKTLPAIPTSYRLSEHLGDGGVPWSTGWPIEFGVPDGQDEESLNEGGFVPFANQPTVIQVTSESRTTLLLHEDPTREAEMDDLSNAMMTVDNGFETQWWNQGPRAVVGYSATGEPVLHSPVEPRLAWGHV
ncbi:hypothetical protein HYQ45_018884 [Verticillium longisporum]|uniref:Inheritance of peroxisomes protein 1 n=1 Tax=Verticillium longisporum TaxID=100787 RepID=A0A8I2ZRF4_VERLO|nr:hypothetical protein HYQ45_018884 [Verticillium longisporum]